MTIESPFHSNKLNTQPFNTFHVFQNKLLKGWQLPHGRIVDLHAKTLILSKIYCKITHYIMHLPCYVFKILKETTANEISKVLFTICLHLIFVEVVRDNLEPSTFQSTELFLSCNPRGRWRNMRNIVSLLKANHNSSTITRLNKFELPKSLPMFLATISLRVVTKILLPGKPPNRECPNCSHLSGPSSHISSSTSRNQKSLSSNSSLNLGQNSLQFTKSFGITRKRFKDCLANCH
ncbi:conserved hypothetical protein [Ricinus communis]|uniref:Uncharacterized protein n=1 Tax=Ricinus communis TaxID=3988 RepID=B9S348_RICCO|nr:conserved hypothetical protein [Ricinus communis]